MKDAASRLRRPGSCPLRQPSASCPADQGPNRGPLLDCPHGKSRESGSHALDRREEASRGGHGPRAEGGDQAFPRNERRMVATAFGWSSYGMWPASSMMVSVASGMRRLNSAPIEGRSLAVL